MGGKLRQSGEISVRSIRRNLASRGEGGGGRWKGKKSGRSAKVRGKKRGAVFASGKTGGKETDGSNETPVDSASSMRQVHFNGTKGKRPQDRRGGSRLLWSQC